MRAGRPSESDIAAMQWCGHKPHADPSGRAGPEASRTRDGGFTLVELLVALVILAMLMAALYAALRFAARGLDSARAHGQRIEELAAGISFLRERLSQAENVLLTTGPRRQEASFAGTDSALSFVAPMPADISLGGLYYFRLRYDAAARATRLDLALYRTREIFSLDEAADRRTRLILPGFRPVFRYYGRDDPAPDAPPRWHDDWPARGWLPKLVEVRLIPAAPDAPMGPNWPPLRIAIAGAD